MARILLVLSANDWAEASRCLESARSNAADAAHLTFGLSLEQQPGEEEKEQMHDLGTSLFLVPGLTPWQDMELLWQGEGCVLAGHAAMRFSRNWDRTLMQALHWCQKNGSHRCALTGYLPRRVDPVDAVYPVAVAKIDRRMQIYFRRGTPLRYAVHPVPSAFLNPDFCFAPATFFRTMARNEGPRFLAAYKEHWDIYTLHRPVIHMLWDNEIQPASLRDV